MSFWEDASPIVKGAIVFGIIGIIVAGLALAGVGPFSGGSDEETTNSRELAPPGG
tara:strand:- start:127 stop:291 length:165 start_codon:yes stop_codon:yes gene_type:complete